MVLSYLSTTFSCKCRLSQGLADETTQYSIYISSNSTDTNLLFRSVKYFIGILFIFNFQAEGVANIE